MIADHIVATLSMMTLKRKQATTRRNILVAIGYMELSLLSFLSLQAPPFLSLSISCMIHGFFPASLFPGDTVADFVAIHNTQLYMSSNVNAGHA